MNPFSYVAGEMHCEGVPLAVIAEQAGTPCYVYSSAAVLDRFRAYDNAFGDVPHRVCYAVKANGNLGLLRVLANAGAGFDVVSGGELFRVLAAGGDPATVVFSGVGKTAMEIEYALSRNIRNFNCESEAELRLLDSIAARLGVVARAGVRVNPDVDPGTHPYISTGLREHKFGIDIVEAGDVYARAKSLANVELESVSCHIGSQLLDTSPLLEAFEKMTRLVDRLRAGGIPIRTLDLGGGLGIAYRAGEGTPAIAKFIGEMCASVGGRELEILIEPGRSIVGEAGVLLTRVLYRKTNGAKEFVIVDAGMNDLIRPALYQAHHGIQAVHPNGDAPTVADIVGPVCESGDFLARDRELVGGAAPGSLLAVCSAGAYAFSLSSNYNARPRAAEVLVEGDRWSVVRTRETYDDLVRGEL